MSASLLYCSVGVLIFVIGLTGVVWYGHLLRKVLAINLMGTGIFMFFIALSQRSPDGIADPVPHAMVLTGIVVAVSATALLLSLIVRLHSATGFCCIEEMIKHQNETKDSHV